LDQVGKKVPGDVEDAIFNAHLQDRHILWKKISSRIPDRRISDIKRKFNTLRSDWEQQGLAEQNESDRTAKSLIQGISG
jgi:hypothetical protein